MAQKKSAQDIIELWSSRQNLADDVSARIGRALNIFAVHRWYQRNRIPAEYYPAIMDAASARGLDVSLLDLIGTRAYEPGQHGHEGAPGRASHEAKQSGGAV
jgi:hypothetical protein